MLQDDSRPVDSKTSFDYLQSQTCPSVSLLPPAALDSRGIDELNPLPVCEAEAVKSDGSTSGSVEAVQLCSGKDNLTEENVRNNDDVIISRAAEDSDARVCEVRVIKGALGLGFCIEGGKGSVAGDRPVSVKRLFRGILYVYWFISQRVTATFL